MFGRRKKDQVDGLNEAQELEVGEPEVAAVDALPEPPPRPTGPWDAADAPEDELSRIDLGGMLVPVPTGMEVRVDVSPEQEVIAATLVLGESAMQVNAFAAPKRSGIWDEVREEIGQALREGGGDAKEAPGPWGTELLATVRTEVPDEGTGFQPARFIGVDGPRWFLRALVTGPAATDREAAAELESALRDVHVVRGGDPMAVRDPLPLRLPKQALDVAPVDEAPQSEEPEPLTMQERGPEITERR